jgi:hypothetical protein
LLNQNKFTKDRVFYQSISFDKSLISILDSQIHRQKRLPLEHFFTTTALQDLYPILDSNLAVARRRMATAHERGEPLDMSDLAGRISASRHFMSSQSLAVLTGHSGRCEHDLPDRRQRQGFGRRGHTAAHVNEGRFCPVHRIM